MEPAEKNKTNVTVKMSLKESQSKTEQKNVSSTKLSKRSSEKVLRDFFEKLSHVTTAESSTPAKEKIFGMNKNNSVEEAGKSVKKSSSRVTNKSGVKKSSEELARKPPNVVGYSQYSVVRSSIENAINPAVNELNITESYMSSGKKSKSSDFNTQTGLILGLLIVLIAAVWYGVQNGRVKAFLIPVRRRFERTVGSSTYDETAPRHYDTLPFDGEPYDSTRPAE